MSIFLNRRWLVVGYGSIGARHTSMLVEMG